MSRSRSSTVAALGATLLALAAAPATLGATLYASPTGLNSGTCTPEASACTLQRAVEDVSTPSDEIVVLPGTYNNGSDFLFISSTGAQNIHGQVGKPIPVLTFGNTGIQFSVYDSSAARLARLRIESTGPQTALNVESASGTPLVEQVFVHKTTNGDGACFINGGNAIVRDTVCWASGSLLSEGLNVFAYSGTNTVNLRNVTTVSAGAHGIEAFADTGTLLMNAKNVIAEGGFMDVGAQTANGGTATVGFDHSSYGSAAAGSGSTITSPGSGANQDSDLTPPHLANPVAGNFHQLLGSPTIDHGTVDLLTGTADLDLGPRILGAAIDIGADEFVPPATAPPVTPPATAPDTAAPDTAIAVGPKRKTRRRRASFQFSSTEPGSSFACKLDQRASEPCTSPKQYRKLKRRRHTFQVQATDGAGNVDPTPAQLTWRVKRPKR